MMLSETWLSSDEPSNAVSINELRPQGYRFEHIPRQNSICQRGGGVGILLRSSIHYKLNYSSYCSSLKITQFEFMDCTLQLTKDITEVK